MRNYPMIQFYKFCCSSSSSAGLNSPELMKIYPTIIAPLILLILQWSLLIHLLGSSSSSSRLNYPEPMKYSSTIHVSSITPVVQSVQLGWTIHRTHEMFSYDPSSLNYSLVEAVQQGWTIHRTHEIFIYDPCSLSYSVGRAVGLDGTTLNS